MTNKNGDTGGNPKNPIFIQHDLTDIEPLGQGEFASVFKATQVKLDAEKVQTIRVVDRTHHHFALKREKDLLLYLNQFSEDFPRFNEIRKQGFSYLQFFDFVGKKSLQQQVDKKGGLSDSKARLLLSNMLSTLKRVHEVGFIHGDVCPDNIIWGKGRYYLVDWSKAIPGIASYETELMVGDKRYSAPERLNGEYTDASDVYALGCTLYFALTAKHIYRLNEAHSMTDQLYAHAFNAPRKLQKLPKDWQFLIRWMTQKDPQKRLGLVDLEQWLVDKTLPKEMRQPSSNEQEAKSDFPQDSLEALANSHYLYALFKQATLYEAQGALETAFNLYENCAFHGYTRAENNLGLMYEKGSPVRQSYEQAMNNFHQAFQKGNPYAAFNLARMFEEGLGTEKNPEQAHKLYRFAALRGHFPAQNKLGMCYWKGSCVNKDIAQARYWFGLAAHYGYEPAASNIKALMADSIKQA
ncbi:Sel1-like repeat-containing protein kinase family protein [Thiosulfativibrio zosterae]|nr:Sel1-like repeat-containing protein kinase family protein [Thiosulfativibrio zosterae]